MRMRSPSVLFAAMRHARPKEAVSALAIAKSYVEACGGKFAVSVDGDLFKVQITFAIQH